MIPVVANVDSLPDSVRTARGLLIVTVLSALFLVGVTFSPLKSGYADAASRGPGDVELYRAEVDRIRQGEGYYDSAAAELRPRGYPTRSIFNWRTPLPMWLIGHLPDVSLAKAVLGAAALALLCLSFGLLHTECGSRSALVGSLLLVGALMPCVLGDLFVMPEVWAGVLLALSLVAYGTDRCKLGFAAGLLALFLRELTAPYCLLCMALAWRRGRTGELFAWTIGLAAYGGFYAAHLSHVLPLIQAGDAAHAHGWVRFGAAGFVISTVQMNVFLLLLPQWATALYLAVALLGFARWNTAAGSRIGLTAAMYVVVFSVLGQPFNQYWGSLIAPLFCLGAARGLSEVCQLGRIAVWPKFAGPSQSHDHAVMRS